MPELRTDPERPWLADANHYEPAHCCPLPALSLMEQGSTVVRWLKPGLTWTCVECGLAYVVARCGSPFNMWISTGLQTGGHRDG